MQPFANDAHYAADYDPENEDQGVDSDDEGTDKQSTVRDSYAPVSYVALPN